MANIKSKEEKKILRSYYLTPKIIEKIQIISEQNGISYTDVVELGILELYELSQKK